MKRYAIILLVGVRAFAEDPALPTIRSFAGEFLGARDHNYFVESELRVPLVQIDPVMLAYDYRESTPFLREEGGIQADVFARRQQAELHVAASEGLRLIGVAGYRSTYKVDRPGFLSAYAIGGGVGSPLPRDGERLQWALTGGAFLSQRNTRNDWWLDLHGSWRAFNFAEERFGDIPFRASLMLIADFEFANDGDRLQPHYTMGPAVQLLTAHGNRAQLQLLWYHTDNNEFYGKNENSFLFGLNIVSSLETNFTARSPVERDRGWFPLIWGEYDLGFAATRSISRFAMNAELIDFAITEQPFTGVVEYESRQEYRVGDFDNIAYSVALGLQTPVGLASVASHDDPLVAGVDFLHRSDHALNPSGSRVAPGTLLVNGSHNLLPRLRLQTTGWDLPYRDAQIYNPRTDWLNLFDWRATAGWDINDDRHRGKFAGQIGLNWDVATVEGYVVYVRGLGSLGNESPDWLGECGVRRPAGKIFTRFESYGINEALAHGDTFVVGFGVNL